MGSASLGEQPFGVLSWAMPSRWALLRGMHTKMGCGGKFAPGQGAAAEVSESCGDAPITKAPAFQPLLSNPCSPTADHGQQPDGGGHPDEHLRQPQASVHWSGERAVVRCCCAQCMCGCGCSCSGCYSPAADPPVLLLPRLLLPPPLPPPLLTLLLCSPAQPRSCPLNRWHLPAYV